MSEELTIDSEHRYWLGKKHLNWPSPTLILDALGISKQPEHWTEEQADYYKSRGSQVHLATYEDDMDKDFDIQSLKPELIIRVQRWRNFKKDSKITILGAEMPIFNGKLQMVGCLDRKCGLLLKSGEQRVLIDIKTGVIPKWVKYQLVAYELILDDGPYQRMAVGLGKDPYELKMFTDFRDRNVFLSMLSTYRAKLECQ